MSEWPSGRERANREFENNPSVEKLRSDFTRTDLARHLAFFYRSPQAQLSVASAFVKHGLQTGHRCLYFFDTNTRSAVERGFRSNDIDVDYRLETGDLLIQNGADAYQEADFKPDQLITQLGEASRDSARAAYQGLYVAGELSWCFHTDLTYDHVVDFEADFDAASQDLPVTALCQYDMSQFNSESLTKALWTHKQVIYRYTLCENPYYVPPNQFRSPVDRPLDSSLPLEQLYDLALARKQVEQREQRLSVVNRVLRHNIRNDMNLVQGVLDLFAAQENLANDYQGVIAGAVDAVDDILEMADKARYVEMTVGTSTVESTSLSAEVGEAVASAEGDYPDARISVEGQADVSVIAATNLNVALHELLMYMIRHQEADSPRVDVRIVDRQPERVRIEITAPNGLVPRSDRQVVEKGFETSLEHADGLGLWLVKWIVENGDGSVVFPDERSDQVWIELNHSASATHDIEP